MFLTQINKYFYFLVFLPFASVFWPSGIFQESDLAFFGLWSVAGLCAIALGLGKFRHINIPTVSCGFFLLAALSVFGIFQNGFAALGGINEIREGTATFLSVAILVMIGAQANMQRFPLCLVPIAYGVITVTGHYGWMPLGWKTYVFLDIAAFPLLASLPMYVAFRKSLIDSQHLWDAAYIASFSFLLFYADNVAAVIACLCAFIFVFLLPLIKKHIPFLPKKDGFYIVFGLSFIAVMIIVSWCFFSYLPSQLQSRTLLGIVTVSQYLDHFNFSKFLHLVFGYGWGSYQEFPVLNIFWLENFTMYVDGNFKPNWEFLQRNLLHSHNLILEAIVSSGLLGAGLMLTIIYKWIESIDTKDWAGRFFVVSYLVLLSAWFQTPTVLVFLIIAMALIKETKSYKLRIPNLAWMICGIFLIVFSCVEFWSSVALNKHRYQTAELFESDVLSFINDPAHAYDKISTYKASNMIISHFADGIGTFTKEDNAHLPSVEKAIVYLAKDYLGSYQKRNVVSSVHIINLCNTFMILPKVTLSVDSEIFKIFKVAVTEHIKRFPVRADMAIGFLNLCFDKLENIQEVNEMADIVLAASPEHPVGLWFKGLSSLSLGIDKNQSLEKMKLAVKLGLCRFMPVPKEVLANLGVQQHAVTID